jgi:hypothetical protein
MSALLRKIDSVILNPLILLGFGVALLYFFWGIFKFLSNADSDDEREIGKRNMFWGIVGMAIMVSVYGLINLIVGTFGLSTPSMIGGPP